MSSQRPRPWFAEREAPVYFFKVNRRPVAQESFLAERIDDPFVHFASVLPFGDPVVTGRRDKRRWLLGDEDIDRGMGLVIGQIGWERPHRRESGRSLPVGPTGSD